MCEPATTGHSAAMTRVHIQLLGGFRLDLDQSPVHVVPGARRLLALLALRDSPVPRQVAATLLWPDATARRASACLRSSLWRLAKPPTPLVVVTEDALVLGEDVEVDFRRACAFAAAPGARPEAVGMLKADLLPGWWQPWVQAERDWWWQARLRALETLSDRFRSCGDHHHAHQAALAAVQTDPLRESAHRTLVELHLADGNPAQAVRQYQSYRRQLLAELGLEPSAHIHELVRPLLR